MIEIFTHFLPVFPAQNGPNQDRKTEEQAELRKQGD
jgi:hypothetical protein